jgi:hypothetical protein
MVRQIVQGIVVFNDATPGHALHAAETHFKQWVKEFLPAYQNAGEATLAELTVNRKADDGNHDKKVQILQTFADGTFTT